MSTRHICRVALDEGFGGCCDCGEVFEGSSVEVLKAWGTHIEKLTLLQEVRDHVLEERAKRDAGEAAIKRLLELGVGSRTVSTAIGHDVEGALMMSPSTVLRIGRDEHVKSPRRRKRRP